MAFQFTTLFSDNLNGADEDPLNPVNWQTDGPDWGDPSCQILNHQCVADSSELYGESYMVASLPNDQWCEAQINTFSPGGDVCQFALGLREAAFFGPYPPLVTALDYNVTMFSAGQIDYPEGLFVFKTVYDQNGAQVKLITIGSVVGPVSTGRLRFATVGSGPVTVYVWVNDALVLTAVDNNADGYGYVTSGTAAIEPAGAVTDVQFTQFKAGSVSMSAGSGASWMQAFRSFVNKRGV